jgi:hypothetical protein
VLNLTDEQQKSTIMEHFNEKKVALPYPCKCLSEPITRRNNRWGMLKINAEQFQSAPWRNPPFCYHNAGVWPFVGAFYALAAWECSQSDLTRTELTRLAEANRLGIGDDWEFPEWLNAETGEPSGAKYQSWNAGTYIMVYKAVVEGVRLLSIKD